MSLVVDHAHWVEITKRAMAEAATTVLALDDTDVEVTEAPPHADFACGGYIAVLTPAQWVQIGIGGSSDTCAVLAKVLLALEPEDPDPEPTEVRDAMGELANIVAGAVKSAIQNTNSGVDIQLGLPFFVYGRICLVGGNQTAEAWIRVGYLRCTVSVTELPQAKAA